ncbi:hypothetical protein [Paenibacillus cymbidii]|uniref:hypothetical protein n=1 Tax=Paenibacillus cymbidii TaxID=1639034 RepID=UPI001F3FA9FF|nr:hypothetical protein [Paenibacillus cymbidii]
MNEEQVPRRSTFMRRKNGEHGLRRKLLQYFPVLYRARVAYLIFKRHLQNIFSITRFAKVRTEETLPYTCKKHQSLLRRKLGSSDPVLQENKITVWLTDEHLKGSVHIEAEWPFSYHVFEKNHAFRKAEGKNYRQNEIWRSTIDKKTGNEIKQERLIANYSEVRYELPNDITLEQSV